MWQGPRFCLCLIRTSVRSHMMSNRGREKPSHPAKGLRDHDELQAACLGGCAVQQNCLETLCSATVFFNSVPVLFFKLHVFVGEPKTRS